MLNVKPILVTGSHRSGSTWVGKMLSSHPDIGYIYEPFNCNHYPSKAGLCSKHFKYWYTYIVEENESLYLPELEKTLQFNYSLNSALTNLVQPQIACNLAKELVAITRDYWYFALQKTNKNVPLMKDPIAFFSTEWLAKKFNMEVIILIRHPAAFAGSLKVARWYFPFEHLLAQKLLIRDHLQEFRDEIETYAKLGDQDIIGQSILLWKMIYSVTLKFKQQDYNWLFIRYEDLSREPIVGFERLFKELNFDFPDSVKKYINIYTQDVESKFINKNPQRAYRVMKSHANIKSWKKRLTVSEIERIRQEVEPISSHFYNDGDWE